MPNSSHVAAAARAGWGCVLLLTPESVLRIGGRPVPGPVLTRLARLLGARQLVQAAVLAGWPGAPVARGGAVVDVLHAATDLWYAVASPRHRPAALLDATIATALAVAGVAATRPRYARGTGLVRRRGSAGCGRTEMGS
ncbi:hypothetical protein GCM10010168_78140 [Actinoplanes ianthinogenes]|uniref:Uncharacterized protein n=1 Tax=Actinoplanes ianthinogenes TaxID=122358 RepID=A0ABM7LKE3_9ACTN|nr:hypothetical protein [Actinoplanes ianthinogenes]BCJ39730.1 hypothetical protein Aiant_03870 [Actinoplanes ianthinogenes]GGR47797.1 hypothetical protein GCM10010168_78140 [Actinoplanes ianthinogenes]